MKEEMGKNPGGEKGKGGMSEKLAKMAAEQEAIRNELQKMAGQMEKEGNSGGKGKMDELSKLMEQTETDLVNRRITEQTLKRQQEILTRLLESEKAEREREMDEKRESKEGKNEKSGNPEQFFEYNMLKQKEAELLRTVPPALSPFYKNKVNEYFNQFNNQ
jgi:septal ring factor EnvC (AmiA/AmiB activator)